MRKLLLLSTVIIGLGLSACSKKRDGSFALENSNIRFVTADLGDPALIAVLGEDKFRTDQILDKSPVIKDLAEQENQIMTGMAYLKMMDKVVASAADKIGTGSVQIHLPKSEVSLAAILQKFDRKPVSGYDITYTPGDANIVATFKELQVSRDEIESQNGLLQSIDQRRFQESLTQLQGQLARILLSQVAQKESKPLEVFIKEKVLGGSELVVSDAEVKAHLDSLGASPNDLTDEGKQVLALTLRQNKEQKMIEDYVAKNFLKGPIQTSLKVPTANLKMSEDWTPVAGYKDAPVAMIAFVGTTCPDCPATLSLLNEIMVHQDGYLKLNVIHSFNANDGIARLFAETAVCLDSMKPKTSLKFMNEMAKLGGQADETKFYEWARDNKMDEAELKKCLLEKRSSSLVEQHLEYGKKVGVLAVPTVWVEGRLLEGSVKPNELKKLVAEKIADSGETWFGAFLRRMKAIF